MLRAKIVWAALFFSLPAVASANDGTRNEESGFKQELMDQLHLTNSQKKSLKAIRKGGRSQIKAKRDQVAELRKTMDADFEKGGSEDDLRKDFASVQAAQQELGKLRFEHLLAVRKVLTPEQRSTFRLWMMEHRRENFRK